MNLANEFRSEQVQTDGRGRQRHDSEQQFDFHVPQRSDPRLNGS
jgi:hypothetical protein